MKVAILTMFNGLSRTYSLVNVVAEHIRMLLDAGEQVKVLVSQDCNDRERHGIFLDERIEWVKVTNRYNNKQIQWRDYKSPTVKVHDTLLEEAQTVGEDLVEKLKDVDVCMMHDIHYQGWHMIHNLAIRYAQPKLPNVRFIAMTHSMPDTLYAGKDLQWPYNARYSPMPNTIYAYPTEGGLKSLSIQYNVDISKCKAINNTIDLIESMSDDIKKLHEKVDLLSSDILIVYPARLTTAKRFDKIAQFAGVIKRTTQKSVKIIFCEFPSIDIDQTMYKKTIIAQGVTQGLSNEDIVFTSDYGYLSGVSRNMVLELFTLSNLYICPSLAESFGLTVLEAASRGNFIILNESVPALKEIGEVLDAYFMKWDARNFTSITKEIYEPNEEEYYKFHAKNIVEKMENNPVLKAKLITRKRYSPKWVYENQLKPLLYDNEK